MDEHERERADLAGWAFREHYGSIYRYLRRKTGNPDRAEELAQQVFADAASALRSFHPGPTPVLALLYTFAQRRFADSARRDGRARIAPVPLDDLAEELAELEHDQTLTAALCRALECLPREQGIVVTMKLVQGCRFAEIARRLGVSEVACKKRFQRGLEALRRTLEEEGFEP